jgi:hypothetical protein
MTDEQDLRERLEHLELDGNQVANVLAIIAPTADQGRQLEAICGALADAGTVLAARQDGDYAASVRELTRRAEWAELLARAAIQYGLIINIKGDISIAESGRWCKLRTDSNGLPIETPELRAALEAALNKE